MSTRPRPQDYPTAWSWWTARERWLQRTGGRLWTTVLLALVVGGLSGSPVLAMVTLVLAVGAHLYIRQAR